MKYKLINIWQNSKEKLVNSLEKSNSFKLLKEFFIDTKSKDFTDIEGMPSGDDRGVIRFGLSVLFVVFVLFGGWMAFAPLTTAAVAIGTVSADTDKKVVQHLQGGNIGKIFVKEGDEVETVVVTVDRKNRSIRLSVKAKDAKDGREALSSVKASSTANAGTTSLGDLLKAKLSGDQE